MESERSWSHLLLEHPFVLFLIGAFLMMSLLAVIGIFYWKRSQRKTKL